MGEKKYYKVLDGDRSCHGGSLAWPLPTGDAPGEWVAFDGRLVPCLQGLHLTDCPAKWFNKAGLSVYEAEYEGDRVACDDDKIVCRKVRLLRALSPADLEGVAIYLSGHHAVKSGHATASGSASVEASGSASVKAYGSASVKASGSASVKAYGSASVKAYDSASVKAYDSASVKAYGSASVEASGSASVEAYGSASVKASGSASVKASGSASVKASGSASVKASGSASVEAYDSASVEASGSASVEAYDSASVSNWSDRCKVELRHMAIQIGRSKYGSVVVRHAPGAAVTLEPTQEAKATGGK